jgi:hypothetical protein
MKEEAHTEPFSEVSFFAASSCSRSVLLTVTCSWRSCCTRQRNVLLERKPTDVKERGGIAE